MKKQTTATLSMLTPSIAGTWAPTARTHPARNRNPRHGLIGMSLSLRISVRNGLISRQNESRMRSSGAEEERLTPTGRDHLLQPA
jgi:hypothetical protein